MTRVLSGTMSGSGLSIGIVAARFNDTITRRLLDGALDSLHRHGVDEDAVTVAWVPGAWELPLVARRLAQSGSVDAVLALGAVIRGATGHYDIVAGQSAAGLMAVQSDAAIPVVNAVLTVESIEQAIERSGTKAGNKGAEAAAVAIEMVNLLRQL